MNTQAQNRVAPAAYDATSNDPDYINRAFRIPAAVDGSAGWTIPGAGVSSQGNALPPCWVTITNISLVETDLMVVRFGRSHFAATLPNASTANDFVILPGATQDFFCESGVDLVKFGGPTSAIASCYRSCK